MSHQVTTVLEILNQGLSEKYKSMQIIFEETIRQELLLAKLPFDVQKYNVCIKRKQESIERIQKIDSGFQPTYERIRGYLLKDAKLYQKSIKKMQEQIREIVEMQIRIQSLEAKNNHKMKMAGIDKTGEASSYKVNPKAAIQSYAKMKKKDKD